MDCLTEVKNDSHFKSLNRVSNYPIINDSLVIALNYYQWMKSTNFIIDNTLCKAEYTLKIFKDVAEPIAVRKLSFIDNVLFNQLELFEKSCPVILESSKIVADKSNKVFLDNLQSTVKTMMWPLTKTINTVTKTSNIAMSTSSSVLESSLNNLFPTGSSKSTHYILDKTDELLDKYLPSTDELQIDNDYVNGNIYKKVKQLSRKTKRKLFKRVMNNIQVIQQSSSEKLDLIQSIIGDIKKKKQEWQSKLLLDAFESINEHIPQISTKNIELIKEIAYCSTNVMKSFSITSTVTLDYILNNALSSFTILDSNLSNMHNMLIKANPEFISDSTLANVTNAIIVIRAWLDLLINLIKIINLIGLKPILAIIEYKSPLNNNNNNNNNNNY